MESVIVFSNFTEDDDPWKEHDFGCVKFLENKLFWKIDYYDKPLDERLQHKPCRSQSNAQDYFRHAS